MILLSELKEEKMSYLGIKEEFRNKEKFEEIKKKL